MAKKIATLAPVLKAATALATAGVAADKAIKAAFGNKRPGGAPYAKAHAEVSYSFLVGYIAGRAGCTEAEAAAIIARAKHGGTGTLAKGQSRRTKEQESIYGAARTGLSRLLSRNGYVSPLQRQRDSNAGGQAKTGNNKRVKAGQGKAKESAAPKVTAQPKVNTREQAYQTLEVMAASMLAFSNKNAKVVNGAIGQLVNRFKLELSSLIVGETK